MKYNFYIDPDITKAETLPASFYQDKTIFEAAREKIFRKSWQWVGGPELALKTGDVYPFTPIAGFLDEPLLLIGSEESELRCLSNVCTHRGNLLVQHAGKQQKLICQYHGRRFDLAGRFEYMPEFKEARNFPRACEDLRQFPLETWGPFIFAGLEPDFQFADVAAKINQRIGFLPLEAFTFDSKRSKDYFVNAHWALYCDNYLEGFHIPYVHEGLNAVIDYGSYTTEVDEYFNLQIAYTDDPAQAFDLPAGHIDHGKNVAAYYYWVFPNMMFNFYPWGLSVNIVKPLSGERTKVSFLTYVYDHTKLDRGAGGSLDKVEQEDELIVESTHQGVNSRYYQSGRFSPVREQGVHHFHRLVAAFLNRD
ncbi:aromatic ring-hydroxylating dioxygenase subunit alpha [Fulvivirgaceae bacterium BMA12]|uniref:Aromatic ring-hydroxylating dioxygenase subunit alpha n=1 Tax=Agaribacillus aureus TaxID=3051825 RepID=A0ABT8L2J2_9BACT|nr:aromatic ring-hydroxylating dioxygenase subunit alpha [Fulvivirgaceae bacterium BMA12]